MAEPDRAGTANPDSVLNGSLASPLAGTASDVKS
jgi:hypothetical protein